MRSIVWKMSAVRISQMVLKMLGILCAMLICEHLVSDVILKSDFMVYVQSYIC